MTNLAYTVIDAADSSLNKTSVLVTGETEALVVDAAFTRADGHRIVAEVLDSGKRLTTVFISAGDPDFYFGAEVIADAFPEATFVAPADVIEHIEHSYQGKLQAWAHLGANLPTRLVDLAPLTEASFTVDGTTIEVRRGSDQLGDRAWYLFEPSSRSLVGGVLLFEGLHVWTADSATTELRAEWIRVLNDLEALDPSFVVAGHRLAGAPTDHTAIVHTRDYLELFEKTVDASVDAAEAEASLLAAYPDAGLKIAAGLGTKVAKGEMTWG
ncbi:MULTISPECIES: MBL fold metallo-hydrolase [unclassified Nocardioides]|uniref:MBL fold metallo-hydrolase n=1 Tax=unclassified Nocardioides TaxID=2615069 RepID=UPI000700D662|nr:MULTISPECIES: MBL fold metallo-hydrolase [unclassified Nocardioides]KRA32494.1 MBL fold metallo-hydrolase [Nocardioides sp. Root614]KRA89148.1 MBL fold metallo-hydrolase [Nocardioides sp. Root682]